MATKLDAERGALDFAGFAQEFLRRNPTYISAYEAIVRDPKGDRANAQQEAMAHYWGLSFPLCAGPIRGNRTSDLARRDFSNDRRPRRGRPRARYCHLG